MTSTSPENSLNLIASFAARALHVESAEVAVSKVTGDASTRSYFRASAGDRSLMVARYVESFDENVPAVERLRTLESANPSARLTFSNDPCAQLETTLLFQAAGLPVPRVLEASGADGLLLLEDLGDLRLQDWMADHSDEEVSEAYWLALKMVVRIQEATELVASGSICSSLAFDEAKLRWELGFFFANYFNKHLHLRLDPATANAVQADFKALCSELAGRDRVLTHRDYHARNLMMHNGRLFIIDYQDARMGPVSYDVASLLSDPYSPLSREAAAELVEDFIEMKSESRLPLRDPDDFRVELQLMTVQRMLKAIGTYASQAVGGNSIYLPYIRPAAERAIEAMRSLGRFDATRALLEQARSSSES